MEVVRAARKPVMCVPPSTRVDVVGEGEDVLGERVVVLQGDFDGRRPVALLDRDRAGVQDLLVAVQVPHERDQPALEVERALAVGSLVEQRDPEALVEVRRLAKPLRDGVEAVVDRVEDLGVGPEGRPRAPPAALRPDLRDRRGGLAPDVLLGPDVAVARGLHAQPLGQGVHDAHADAVEPAGDLVAAAAELAAGMQHGVDDLEGVLARGVLPDGDAASIVGHHDGGVGEDADLDPRGVAGHGLVDRVVDDLPDEMVQAPDVGRADVHAGPPAHGLEALEHLDARRRVVAAGAAAGAPARRRGRGARWSSIRHAFPPVNRS